MKLLKTLLTSSCAIALGLLSYPAYGVTVGNHEATPIEHAQPQNPAFVVNAIHLRALPQDVNSRPLENLLQQYQGQPISAKLLQHVLNEVTRYYQDLGYSNARAYLPEQEIVLGNIDVVVAASTLNKVSLKKNTSLVRDSYLQYLLGALKDEEGHSLNLRDINEELLSLSDIGIFNIRGEFTEPNKAKPYAEDLALDVSSNTDRFNFTLFADNDGNESSGVYRYGGALNIASPTGSADKLSLFFAKTDEDQYNYSFDYNIPVNSHPSSVGMSYCYSNYELGRLWAELGAQGHSSTFALYWNEPLYRSQTSRVWSQLRLDYSDLEDSFKTFDLTFKKHSMAAHANVSGAFRINSFITANGDIELTHGAFYADQTYDTASDYHYTMVQAHAQVQMDLSKKVYSLTKFNGQLASTALDGSSQMLLGGQGQLSAYEASKMAGDSAFVIREELWMNISTAGLPFGSSMQAGPHIEYGQSHNHGYSSENALSYGFQVKASNKYLELSADYSMAAGSTPMAASNESEQRFCFSLISRF